jgi:putative transposase
MTRANRYFIAGNIWHIVHRCHKKEFLLKFKRDRDRWKHWLFEAKKRFGLSILNYTITSNHIHLLVENNTHQPIAKSMQLIAGRTALEFNARKKRKGAYWDDRYHATAVDTDQYLMECLTYIDLNMVRAGVVNHPKDWLHGGYYEIQNPTKQYRLINTKRLCQLLSLDSEDSLRTDRAMWINNALKQDKVYKDEKWIKNLAIGGFDFTEVFIGSLGMKGQNRVI